MSQQAVKSHEGRSPRALCHGGRARAGALSGGLRRRAEARRPTGPGTEKGEDANPRHQQARRRTDHPQGAEAPDLRRRAPILPRPWERYVGRPSRVTCRPWGVTSVASAFKNAADENPGLGRGQALQPGRRAPRSAKSNEDQTPSERFGRASPKLRPRHRELGLHRLEERRQKAGPGPSRCSIGHAIDVDPLHTVEARNTLAQILRDKARTARPDEKKQYVGQAVEQPAHGAGARQANNLQAFLGAGPPHISITT